MLNLRVGEFRADMGHKALRLTRLGMRGTKDPPSPLDHILHDGLGSEQVAACDEMN